MFATLCHPPHGPPDVELPLSIRTAFRPVLTSPPNVPILLEAMLLTRGFSCARALVQGLIQGLREIMELSTSKVVDQASRRRMRCIQIPRHMSRFVGPHCCSAVAESPYLCTAATLPLWDIVNLLMGYRQCTVRSGPAVSRPVHYLYYSMTCVYNVSPLIVRMY